MNRISNVKDDGDALVFDNPFGGKKMRLDKCNLTLTHDNPFEQAGLSGIKLSEDEICSLFGSDWRTKYSVKDGRNEVRMRNFERYKTVQEREAAFIGWCENKHCTNCKHVLKDGSVIVRTSQTCILKWLEQEAEEDKLMPCPFCGNIPTVHEIYKDLFDVLCVSGSCAYSSCTKKTRYDAIAAHNRVARAVIAAKKKEAK